MQLPVIGTISWNNLQFTKDFLKSLEKLNFHHIVLVWDNGSNDGTWEWLKNHQEEWRESFIQNKRTLFEINHSELNEGMCLPWNWMLSYLDQSPYADQVWLCNNDIKFTSSMNTFPTFIREHSEYGMITPFMIPRDIPDEYLEEYMNEHSEETKDIIELHGLNGPVMGISKDTFRKVGFMDERFKFSFEDMDYNERCKKVGLNSCVVHSCGVWHYGGASTGKNPLKIEENPYYKLFQKKHG